MKRISFKNSILIVFLFGSMWNPNRSDANPCLPLAQTIPGRISNSSDHQYLISKYQRFHEIASEAKRYYQSLTRAEQSVLQSLKRAGANDEEVRLSLIAQIQKSTLIKAEPKAKLIQALGLTQKDPGIAMESYRRHYEYFFWTDHSETHLKDVLLASQNNAKNWPKEYVAPYDAILNSPKWSKQISKSIELHDSLMPEGRTLHAELLLREDPHTFPKEWTASERNTSSVLAMLHSKTLLPYSELSHWDQVLSAQIIPKLQKENLITASRAQELNQWMAQLSASDKKDLALSAAWIRMADANRPIGQGLKNSVGDSFFLDPHTRALSVDPASPVTVGQSQFHEIYGSVALQNLEVVALPDHAFAAQFRTNLLPSEGIAIVNEINKFPFLQWIEQGTWKREVENLPVSPEARSTAAVLCSVLADFPPGSFQKIHLIP